MIRKYVKAYIDKLTLKDAIEILKKEGLNLDMEEVNFLFNYTKKNWEYLFDNQDKIFKDLKANLKLSTYEQIKPILITYQIKYKSYL